MHNLDMSTKIAHGKVFLTMRAWFPNLLMNLLHMSVEVVNTDVDFTIWAVGLFAQVDTLNMAVKQTICMKCFLTVGAFVVPDIIMR